MIFPVLFPVLASPAFFDKSIRHYNFPANAYCMAALQDAHGGGVYLPLNRFLYQFRLQT